MSIASYILKKTFDSGDNIRDKGLQTPANIKRNDDISYGKHGAANTLDVYYPKDTACKLPTIINVHGGGWVYGDKHRYQFYCMEMAAFGFTVINFSYRLAPKFKFPAQLEDVNNVVMWTLLNHEKYFIDTDNTFLVGDSAGAHLASLYTAFCTDEKYQKEFTFSPPKDFVPNALVLNCGIYDVKTAVKNKSSNTRYLIKDLMGKEGYNNHLDLIAPLSLVNEKFPPIYLMSALGDFLLHQIDTMEKRLKSLGVVYEKKIYGTQHNKLMHVFHLNIRSDEAKLCNSEEADFINRNTKK